MQPSQSTIKLANDDDWDLSVNADRVLVRCRRQEKEDSDGDDNWIALSSAVLNGGLQKVNMSRSPKISSSTPSQFQIINAKVPSDSDGANPNPKELLRQFAAKEEGVRKGDDDGEGNDDDNNNGSASQEPFTIGLLTAASMNSLRVSSQTARIRVASSGGDNISNFNNEKEVEIFIDAIVTAGISNARVAGANADVFYTTSPDSTDGSNGDGNDETNNKQKEKEVSSNHDENEQEEQQPPPPFGTINTIIITNICLDPSIALVEAYAIAIEAKCRAITELGIKCRKHPNMLSTGTGTDSTALLCRRTSLHPLCTNANIVHPYAGKHTLIGELIGQVVYEATKQAVESNLDYLYKNKYFLSPKTSYKLYCYKLQLLQALIEGHRPLVPSQPMNPIPTPKDWVLSVGIVGVLLIVILAICVDSTFSWTASNSIHVNGHQCQISSSSFSFISPSSFMNRISILLVVFWFDRFLGSLVMPLTIHPVVLVGKVITTLLRFIPESYFQSKHYKNYEKDI